MGWHALRVRARVIDGSPTGEAQPSHPTIPRRTLPNRGGTRYRWGSTGEAQPSHPTIPRRTRPIIRLIKHIGISHYASPYHTRVTLPHHASPYHTTRSDKGPWGADAGASCLSLALEWRTRSSLTNTPHQRCTIHRLLSIQGDICTMKAVKTNAGSCDKCGAPAAYAQLLPAGKRFLFCAIHVPQQVKMLAERASTEDKR